VLAAALAGKIRTLDSFIRLPFIPLALARPCESALFRHRSDDCDKPSKLSRLG
jgi:hypothetical protein